MSISLQKGQQISLTKEAPGLTKVMCGLGWDIAQSGKGFFSLFSSTDNFDLDSSVLCLNDKDKIVGNDNLIYFGHLKHPSSAIVHLGDNLTGEGTGDDEQIIVDLPKIPVALHKLVFTVNIYKCLERQQDFGQVKNAFVRLVNLENNREIARYNLSGAEYQGNTGMILAEIHRQENDWQMLAIGKGVRVNNLQGLIKYYND